LTVIEYDKEMQMSGDATGNQGLFLGIDQGKQKSTRSEGLQRISPGGTTYNKGEDAA
jgi:hypothetical protein